LSAVLDWSQFEACGVKGAADVKDMDAVLVIKDAENNVLSKENISVSY
jgi:cell division protein FtsB